MYISDYSGHHRASLAIENAFHELSDDIETFNINAFQYINPVLEKIINRTYMSVIRRTPEVWGYLYDNPKIVKKTQGLKKSIHRHNSHKIKSLLDKFTPQAVICTQAFPCGVMADCKKTFGINPMLSGVLTDYAPHSYWLYDAVDAYFVPSEETGKCLISNGISEEKVKFTGIPIDPKFRKIIDKKKIRDSLNFSGDLHTVLIMGGSQGMGPIKELVKILDGSRLDFQIIVVAGGNKKLYRSLKMREARFKKKIAVFGYADNIDELMEISSLIISKPGGITISESFAKGLPVLVVKPIPGHEQMNTEHLVRHKVAIKIDKLSDAAVFVAELFSNPQALKNMRERVKAFSKPNSATNIAKTILERIM